MYSDIRSPLLVGDEIRDGKRTCTQRAPVFDLEDVVKDDVKIKEGKKEKKEPPYSLRNEICFFYKRGIPLGLSSLLQWGIPSMYLIVQCCYSFCDC